ncbi:9253_t:CDS:2 [Ambispora gerdemannii]|uniref:9253_t:CDS:1 n=1 Tax=Ambispora gerdemannii TaxID=144530 RepID=A0A9N9FPT2_9GLOM|nr:9253_t:CDS:2 [Ambispora gerdemannii]
MSNYGLTIKVVNAILFLALFGDYLYSVFKFGKLPHHGDPTLGNHPTIITPAPYSFYIWYLINFLFFGFIIYQFFPDANDVVVNGIKWHFLAFAILNLLSVQFWLKDDLIISWLVTAVLLSQISFVYYRIRNEFPANTLLDKIFVHAPLTMYHAWTVVILVITSFAAFIPEDDEKQPDEEERQISLVHYLWVFVAFVVLEGNMWAYNIFGDGDALGGLAIAWAFFGISQGQHETELIHVSARVLAIFTIAYSANPLIKKFTGSGYRSTGGENAPLLS